MKQPSPLVNPANQCGSLIFWSFTNSLPRGVILGKASTKLEDKPQFIEALIAIIFCKPSNVKCSLFCIKINACLKKRLAGC